MPQQRLCIAMCAYVVLLCRGVPEDAGLKHAHLLRVMRPGMNNDWIFVLKNRLRCAGLLNINT